MSMQTLWRKITHSILGGGLAILLSGCVFSPGQFTSQLDLRKSGAFTFTYQGEIYLIALGQLADMADDAAKDFSEQPCYNDDDEERGCSSSELEQQRAEWAENQDRKANEGKRNAGMLSSMLGGVDPSNPEAAQEIADRLSRQHGWNSVEYQGDGMFSVDFSISSQLSHDFIFPIFEKFPMANSFVQASLRDTNSVRIEAPGFSAQSSGGNPMGGMFQAAAMAGDSGSDGEDMPKAPEMDGTFTITTDAIILANNTDEGPTGTDNGQKLTWVVNARSAIAPMALIQLGE